MPSTAVDKAMWGEKRARTLAYCVLVLLVAASIGAFLAANPAHADATFTVDRSDDPALTSIPTAGACTTTTANDCTLRGAIRAANSTSGADTINFNISEDPNDPADDVKTILVDGTDDVLSTNLPVITEAVTIDGYTQPGASPNTKTDLAQGTNANLLIALDGVLPGSSDNGLRISASDVVVKGLVIERFLTGIFIQSGGSGAVIRGNFIGTDPSGTQNSVDAHNGVVVVGVGNNIIGGQEPAARNLISGNLSRGLQIAGSGGNTIQGNLIGTKANGTGALGNSWGVEIGAPNNTVGGIDSDPTDTNNPANLIAFNGTDGVKVNGGQNSAFAVGNSILSNSIFSNGDLGIDLDGGTSPSAFGDGATPNDTGDGDTGPNNLQNFPVLTLAGMNDAGSTTIEGTLNSTPSTPENGTQTFTIQFFVADFNPFDPSDHGEGKTYLGQKSDVVTDANGNASFSFTPQENISCCQYVTATATRLDTSTSPATPKDTSEFSEAVPMSFANDPPVNSVPGAQSTNEDSALVFSQDNGNQVSVSDPDAGILGSSSSVKVRLQVDHGTITLGGTSGLSFGPGDSGTNDADMTFTGPLADVNAALDGMRFDPAANYNGGATLTITTDDQGNTGAGGAKTDTDTVRITVNAVNDDTPTADSQSVTTNEDTAKPITLTGSDIDGDNVTFEITGSPTNGTLGTIGSVSCTGTAPKTCSADVTYTPNANSNGTDSFTFKANDGTAGSNVATVSITLNPVNDAPSFTKGSNQSVQDKAGAQSVANWATNISVGPPDEGAQSLQFILTSDNDALFTATGGPAVSSNGTLTYTPAVNTNGTANVQVVARDSGGSANGGGDDTSDAQSFTITVKEATPPRVTNATPTGKGVKRNTNVVATFSEKMNRTTLSKSTFKLFKVNADGSTKQITNVTVSSTTHGLKAKLNPFGTSSTLLTANTRYRVVVTTGAKDLAGNALDQSTAAGNQPKVWTFTTGST